MFFLEHESAKEDLLGCMHILFLPKQINTCHMYTSWCSPFQGLNPLPERLDLGFGEDIGLGLLNRCLSKSLNPGLWAEFDTRIISV